MQAIYQDIQAEGAEVIVISSDNQVATKRSKEQVKAQFVILSDSAKKAIAAYNATDPVNANIALPQFYIIDEEGIILWKHIDVRTVGRLDPVKVLEALREL